MCSEFKEVDVEVPAEEEEVSEEDDTSTETTQEEVVEDGEHKKPKERLYSVKNLSCSHTSISANSHDRVQRLGVGSARQRPQEL